MSLRAVGAGMFATRRVLDAPPSVNPAGVAGLTQRLGA